MRFIFTIMIAVVFVFASNIDANAQLAKSGKVVGSWSWVGNLLHAQTIDGVPRVILAEYSGPFLYTEGKFPALTLTCAVALEYAPPPELNLLNLVAMCTGVDGDGDLLYLAVQEPEGTLGGPGQGKFTWFAGTGKYKGINGAGWYKSTPQPDPGPGKFAGINEFGFTYKIP